MSKGQHGNITIIPTGTCFDDAVDYLDFLIMGNEKKKDWHKIARLAHGILLHEHDNKPYAHAWVELYGKEVWQDGFIGTKKITFFVDKNEFYEKARLQSVTIYTLRELGLENLRTGHVGPWKKEYDDLTKNPRWRG